MNWGQADTWDDEQIEAWEHNEWLLMQELWSDYYKLHRRYDYDSEGEDEYEAKRLIEWEEEEEKGQNRILQKDRRGGKERLLQENSCRAD